MASINAKWIILHSNVYYNVNSTTALATIFFLQMLSSRATYSSECIIFPTASPLWDMNPQPWHWKHHALTTELHRTAIIITTIAISACCCYHQGWPCDLPRVKLRSPAGHNTVLARGVQNIRNTCSFHDIDWIQVKLCMIPYWCHLLNSLQSV